MNRTDSEFRENGNVDGRQHNQKCSGEYKILPLVMFLVTALVLVGWCVWLLDGRGGNFILLFHIHSGQSKRSSAVPRKFLLSLMTIRKASLLNQQPTSFPLQYWVQSGKRDFSSSPSIIIIFGIITFSLRHSVVSFLAKCFCFSVWVSMESPFHNVNHSVVLWFGSGGNCRIKDVRSLPWWLLVGWL